MFHKKKKENLISDAALYGFAFADQPLTKCSDRVLSCVVKGLFIFAAVYGSLGGLISSFDLPCHPFSIFGFLLLFSFAMAFLHYSRLIFNIFYPLVFLFFTFSIFSYRYYVYSGFQAFINIWQEKYSTYFDLSILREANEYFSDRYMTITVAAIFIGFFLIVLLNIAISEYMNLTMTILLTFPIFQLGIYIDEMPDFPYLVLLLFSYFMIAILKRSEHFLLPYRDKKNTEFSFKQKNKTRIWRYHASGRIMLQLTGIFFAFSLFLGIVCLPFLSFSSATANKSELRKKADEYVKIFTQSGLSGFFNRYEATGGLSEGRLGGISSVRPDYETDLIITFAPFSYETLYLRAYVSQEYTGSEWTQPSYSTELSQRDLGVNYNAYETYTAFLEGRRMGHYMDENPGEGIFGKMQIENADVSENYMFLPYYSNGEISLPHIIQRGVPYGYFAQGTSYTTEYYPLLHDYWMVDAQPDEMRASLPDGSPKATYISYYDMINTTCYLDMPEETRKCMEEIQKKIPDAANVDAQIAAVQEYLQDNYTYSMSPGTTPRSADFAVHFLTSQNSGYCAHFATAATLLLRSYGIPARYVEGYAVPFQSVAEGTALDVPYDEWFTGENPLGETGVVEVEVSDASAHAWVEVYKIGIGWVPYEFTPPDTSPEETDNAYTDFWGLFSGIFGQNPPPETVDTIEMEQDTDSAFEKAFGSSSFLAGPLLSFVGFIALLLLMIRMIRITRYQSRIRTAYRRGDYAPLLAHHYRRLCMKLKQKGLVTCDFLLPSALAALPAPIEGQNCVLQMERLEKCCYSQHSISKDEADEVLKFLKLYATAIKRKKK